MRFWNGVVMYAPRTPDYYAIPGSNHCVFRLMHKHGDVQAWNLYWLTKPTVDLVPMYRENWHEYYRSFNGEETRAFYEALDTAVLNHLTLATLMAQPPREAIRLLQRARLERTHFYHLAGQEYWRETMHGRLFLAERLSQPRAQNNCQGAVLDFGVEQLRRAGSTLQITKRPA